jgi:hypothetical protein
MMTATKAAPPKITVPAAPLPFLSVEAAAAVEDDDEEDDVVVDDSVELEGGVAQVAKVSSLNLATSSTVQPAVKQPLNSVFIPMIWVFSPVQMHAVSWVSLQPTVSTIFS